MFVADWNNALFIHFQIDPAILKPVIPFELDLWQGQAFVSLVAFTQAHLRPTVGGKIFELLSRPLATHEFLNLRAYVHVDGESGIYFIAEWIPNWLATLIGPRMYGLPYRLGDLNYQHANPHDLQGQVIAANRNFSYHAAIESTEYQSALPNTLDHFLLERYVGFTHRKEVSRRFRIAHEPWLQARTNVVIDCAELFSSFNWMPSARMISANYSPGVNGVQIGRPERIYSIDQRLAIQSSVK